MGDRKNLDQLKTQYRIRFYRDRSEDLPEFRPGSNVLSAIKNYFNDTGGEESPGISRSSFFADSETNINIPGSMRKKTDSSTNPRISKLNRLYSTGEINETKMKATTNSAANKKFKTPPHFNNFDDNISEEEVDDCESDMPFNLLVDKETEIFRSVRSVSRDRIYSLDSSVVQGSPSPASKSSPQKRLCFSDAVVKDKESFASRYTRGPAEDVETMQMDEFVSYAGNKSNPRPNATSAQYVAKVGDDEFVIEDDDSIDMCFSFVNKISPLEGSKAERSAASSSTHGNQKLQAEASEVISGQSPISHRKRSSQTRRGSNVNRKSTTDESKTILSSEGPEETQLTSSSGTYGNQKLQAEASEVISGQSPISQRKRSNQTRRGSNVNRKSTTDESKTILGSEGPEETKRTPSSSKIQTTSATYASQTFSSNFKAMFAQSLVDSKTIQQTRQTNKELEMAEEENFDMIWDNRARIQIPRNPKSKVERSESSSVSHQMEVEMEPTKTIFEQSTVQYQAVGNTLKDDKTNKTKDLLCKDSFTSHFVSFANIRPPITRIDISDLPVMDEEEFFIHDTDFENDPKGCKMKTVKVPNDSKNKNKRGKNVAIEVFNGLSECRRSQKCEWGTPEKENQGCSVQNHYTEQATYTSARKSDNATDSRKSHNDGRDSSSPLTVSHQMEVEIEPAETVCDQSIVQSQTVKKPLKDDKTKDSLCKDKNTFASHLARIANIQPPLTRMDVPDLPVMDEDEFVIHDNTDFENDPKSCKRKTVKNPNDSKKSKKRGKNVACEVLNATYISARTSDNNAIDLRKSHNDERDSSSPSDKKKSRPTELDRLVLQKYLQADVDNQSESISTRPKRASAPPSAWWVVRPAERNFTFAVEEDLPQSSPKSKREAYADTKEPSESQKHKDESFELKESGPLDQNEEKTLKESGKTLNTRKRTKKTKHVESEEMTGPSKAKNPKINNSRKKPQTTPRNRNKSTKLQKQLEQEKQEVDTKGPQENDSNVPDLSNETESFSRAPIPESPTMNEPQYPSPRKHKHVLDESSKKSPASGSGIPYKYLKNWKRTEEGEPHPHDSLPYSRAPIPENPTVREPQRPSPRKHKPVLDESSKKSPASGSGIPYKYLKNGKRTEKREPHPHNRLPHQSYTSPAFDFAKLTFQSGPVLKTRPMRYIDPMDTVVRNLSTAASLNVGDMSPLTIVLDPDTDSDTIADCVQHSRESNPSLVWRCFNNTIFSAGKIVLKPKEKDMRDAPKCDILVFYIVRGRIVLKLHKTLHVLESGDFFYIPPCNTYHMQNFGTEDVELVFTQLKTRAK